MGKKGPSKQQKKLEKALAKKAAAKDAKEAGGTADAGAVEGLCPCATRLKGHALFEAISGHPVDEWTCHGCMKDGGKARRGCGGDAALWVCLTCGYCGCWGVHARAHHMEHQGSKKKMTHTLYLPVTEELYAGVYGGHCMACDVGVGLRPYDDAYLHGSGDGGGEAAYKYVEGQAVDFDGYLLDEGREFNDVYQECCMAVMSKGMMDGAPSGTGFGDASGAAAGGKKSKLNKKAQQQLKKQQLLLRGKANRAAGVRSSAGRTAGGGVEGAAAAAGLVGLQNFGNTCYFNAAVQAIAATPTLVQELRSMCDAHMAGGSGGAGVHAVTAAAAALVLRMAQGGAGGGVSAQLRAVLAEVRRTGPQFQGFDQHDSQELLRHLTDTISMEFATAAKAEGRPDSTDTKKPSQATGAGGQEGTPLLNPFAAVFAGALSSGIRCADCKRVSATEEVFYDISLPVRPSIPAALAAFFEEEALEDCRYPCPSCNKAAHEAYLAAQARERAAAIEALMDKQGDSIAGMSLQDLLCARDADDDDVAVEDGDADDNEDDDDGGPEDASEGSSAGCDAGEDDGDDGVAQQQQHVDPINGVAGRSASPAPVAAAPTKVKAEKLFTTASKQYAIRAPPRALMLHLKRFKFCRQRIAFVKDTAHVDVPEYLDVNGFIECATADGEVPSDDAPAVTQLAAAFPNHPRAMIFNEYLRLDRSVDAATKWLAAHPPPRYRLYATIEHKGEVGYGHYVAHVRAGEKWYECDDTWVHASSMGQAVRSPYVVLYAMC